jgi:hypothetical protein
MLHILVMVGNVTKPCTQAVYLGEMERWGKVHGRGSEWSHMPGGTV